SQAPSLIHEEGDLVKRSIRDLYTSEVDEVLVEGEDAYKQARGQMKMLIPSHVKRVQKYEDALPIFQRYQVVQQMDTIHSPQVTLRSGGYLVINQTEALVAIDVNSGRSTRERNIEETALKTNLEAADELARQLRLRDLSGLIVVDFIDMEDNRNQQAVERRMKDAMRNDRARIQIGSISHFGLLEMSRQRLRLSFNESISSVCPHCEGSGRVRSVETAALQMLRVIEDEASKGRMDELRVTINRDVALYILNHKRDAISALEERFEMRIVILAGDSLIATEHEAERIGFQGNNNRKQAKPAKKEAAPAESSDEDTPDSPDEENGEDDQPKRRKRGRRGGRRRRRRGGEAGDNAGEAVAADDAAEAPANDDEPAAADSAATEAVSEDGESDPGTKTRGKSRGRSRGRKTGDAVAVEDSADTPEATDANKAEADAADDAEAKPKRRTRKKAAKAAATLSDDTQAEEASPEAGDAATSEDEAPAKKKATRAKAAKSAGATKKKASKKAAKKAAKKAEDTAASEASAPENDEAAASRTPISSAPQDVIEVGQNDPSTKRKGWWNRG
ncbi:MAG: ribonuclease E/G, partial [Rhodobiaceae bacterium]